MILVCLHADVASLSSLTKDCVCAAQRHLLPKHFMLQSDRTKVITIIQVHRVHNLAFIWGFYGAICDDIFESRDLEE